MKMSKQHINLKFLQSANAQKIQNDQNLFYGNWQSVLGCVFEIGFQKSIRQESNHIKLVGNIL